MTKENLKKYTILLPDMLPIHFTLFSTIFEYYGYKSILLRNTGREIVDEGLKYVHNDTCYPALLVIGQFISALKSGKYDLDKTALMISQTGGGCRASNYIHLLRKALKKEFPHIPVISINFSGMDGENAFPVTLPMLLAMANAVIYGDLLMSVYNQCKPYEIINNSTDKKLQRWIEIISDNFKKGRFIATSKHYTKILNDFNSIERSRTKKTKVGIVGEIYVKYSPLANNNLEKFLISENCEPVLPPFMEFVLYCVTCSLTESKLYKYTDKKTLMNSAVYKFALKLQKELTEAIKKHGVFAVPHDFKELRKTADLVINQGVTMGEGWLIPAEMATLVQHGINNIVCAQPFGCLPNHIIGKGMIRAIKDLYPNANIVPIDYDPGATPVNQENRIKLMLSVS